MRWNRCSLSHPRTSLHQLERQRRSRCMRPLRPLAPSRTRPCRRTPCRTRPCRLRSPPCRATPCRGRRPCRLRSGRAPACRGSASSRRRHATPPCPPTAAAAAPRRRLGWPAVAVVVVVVVVVAMVVVFPVGRLGLVGEGLLHVHCQLHQAVGVLAVNLRYACCCCCGGGSCCCRCCTGTRDVLAPHRHDGALDCHGMNCSALAPRYEALFNLSSQDHLPTNA